MLLRYTGPVRKPVTCTTYGELLSACLSDGVRIDTDTFNSEGSPVGSRCIYGTTFHWDLGESGFPAITERPLVFSSVVKELLWFLRGETNTRTLGCGIWDANAGEDGECGPIYGRNWRRWPTPDGGEFDAFGDMIARLRSTLAGDGARNARRIAMTSWNAPLIDEMALPPCHSLAVQLHVIPSSGTPRLDVTAYWRSTDIVRGFPFNIAMYGVLLSWIATMHGLEPGSITVLMGNAHLYDDQVSAAEEMLRRGPADCRTLLEISDHAYDRAPDLTVEQVRKLDHTMFRLHGYRPRPKLEDLGDVAR